MFRYATEYYAAAIVTDDALGNDAGFEFRAPSPVNFLIGRAIELALKAYLLQCGVPHRRLLFELKHDLEACLAAAEELNFNAYFQLKDEELEVLKVLNTLYASKQFEYSVTGYKTFPVFGPLQVLAKSMILAVACAVPSSEHCLRRKAGIVLKQT